MIHDITKVALCDVGLFVAQLNSVNATYTIHAQDSRFIWYKWSCPTEYYDVLKAWKPSAQPIPSEKSWTGIVLKNVFKFIFISVPLWIMKSIWKGIKNCM